MQPVCKKLVACTPTGRYHCLDGCRRLTIREIGKDRDYEPQTILEQVISLFS